MGARRGSKLPAVGARELLARAEAELERDRGDGQVRRREELLCAAHTPLELVAVRGDAEVAGEESVQVLGGESHAGGKLIE